jgi:hypothetical protein
VKRLAIVLPFFLMACSETLPPPSAPPREVPRIENPPGPAAQGEGQVVLDAHGERAAVALVLGHSQGFASAGGRTAVVYSTMTRRVCVETPCATNLPYGQHELIFQSREDPSRVSSAAVTIGEKPSVVRHAMGTNKSNSPAALVFGLVSMSIGIPGIITGGIMAGAMENKEPGFIILGSGIGLTTLGALLLYVGRVVRQEGTTVQWVPNSGPQGVGQAITW